MVSKTGTLLGVFFAKKNYINENDIDAVRYWLEVVVNEYVGLAINIWIGFILGKGIDTIVYLYSFIFLRKYIQGYHCKTMIGCNIVSFSLYFISIYINEKICANLLLLLLFGSFIIVILVKGIKRLKEFMLLLFMYSVVLFIVAFLKQEHYIKILVISMIEVIMLKIIGIGYEINKTNSKKDC